MIKIIQTGITRKASVYYRLTCYGCGCKFECDNTDIVKTRLYDDITGEINCPCCNSIIKADWRFTFKR